MFTRRRQPTRHSSGEEDDGDIIPPTAPGMAAPEGPADALLPAEQHCAAQAADLSPSEIRRTASTHLAELLGAAAELAAKLDVGELLSENIALEPRGVDIVSAAVRARDSPATPPDRAATILVGTRSRESAIYSHSTATPWDVPALHRRFSASCTLVGWTEEEALKALPTSRDDDALAAFYAILQARQSTLSQAFKEMAAVYNQCAQQICCASARGSRDFPRLPKCSVVPGAGGFSEDRKTAGAGERIERHPTCLGGG
ncbi:unnamed protein product [Lampetra fluviatilis]